MGWREVVGKWGNQGCLKEGSAFEAAERKLETLGVQKGRLGELAHVRPWVPCPALERKEGREGGEKERRE